MKVFNIITVLMAIILLNSCVKDKNPIVENQKIDFRYVVNFQNDKLISYYKYDNIQDTLLYQVTFDYHDGYVTEQKVKNNTIEYKHKYVLEDGLAVESYDTIYTGNLVTDLYYNKYYHTNGRLIKKETDYKKILSDTTIHYNQVFEYSYSNDGNITSRSIESNIGFGDFSCWDSFTYSDKQNIFDVNCFNSRITGELSNNLLKKRTYDNGCPSGPSYIYPTRSYEYEINNSNFVTLLTETYISGYASDTTTVKTKFEYTIN